MVPALPLWVCSIVWLTPQHRIAAAFVDACDFVSIVAAIVSMVLSFSEEWQTAMEQNRYDARTQQQVLKMLKIPRGGPHPQHRTCDHCHAHIPDDQAAKCSICFNARYCSAACQQDSWRVHKKTCRPPAPKVDKYVALVVPEFECMLRYQHWFIKHPGSDTLGYTVMVENKHVFEKAYGHDAIERTVLKLALTGQPHPYAVMVFVAKETASSGSAGSGHAASPPSST